MLIGDLPPGLIEAFGAAVGAFTSSLAFTRRKMRAVAREVVAEHERSCPWRPGLPARPVVEE
jgi:hypothetical protein